MNWDQVVPGDTETATKMWTVLGMKCEVHIILSSIHCNLISWASTVRFLVNSDSVERGFAHCWHHSALFSYAQQAYSTAGGGVSYCMIHTACLLYARWVYYCVMHSMPTLCYVGLSIAVSCMQEEAPQIFSRLKQESNKDPTHQGCCSYWLLTV